LTCKIPLNFEYEFKFIKENTDIKIFPSKGTIPGKSSIEIEIIYTPSSCITIDVEAEVKFKIPIEKFLIYF